MQEPYYSLPRLRIDQRMTVNDDRELKRKHLFIDAIYDQVLDYMVNEMNRNLQSEEFRQLQQLSILEDTLPLLELLMKLFRTGGEWDHKAKLQRYTTPVTTRSGDRKLFVTPIRGDNTYLYYYDIWSNIHYGFIMNKLEFWDDFSSITAGRYGAYTATMNYVRRYGKNAISLMKSKIIETQYYKNKQINRSRLFQQIIAEFEDTVSISIGQKLARNTASQVNTGDIHRLIFEERNRYDEGKVRFRWDQLRVL